MNLKDLHKQFLRYLAVEEGLSIRTTGCMRTSFGTFQKRTGIENLNELNLETLKGFFYEGKEKYQWSVSTFWNYHKYLKRFFVWLIGEGHVKENLLLKIKKPKKPQTLPRRLSSEEATKVLHGAFSCDWYYAFESPRNYAIIAMFLYTGIRLNELLHLQLTDINLDRGEMLIRQGKGGKDRYVPLHYKIIRILKQYMQERRRAGKDSIWLFNGAKSNKPLNEKAMSRICKKISIHCGVKFTPHPLRHTFGSISIEQGLSVVKLKEIMGHSHINSTMIYLRMSPQNLKSSLDCLELF
jgi:site-specific recombinase XerD